MSDVIYTTYLGRLHTVPVDDVTHFRADSKYVVAHHAGGELLLDEPLHALETRFGERFVRIHRGTLVSAKHLKAICPQRDGCALAMVEGVSEPLTVSRRHRRSAITALAIKTGSRIDAR